MSHPKPRIVQGMTVEQAERIYHRAYHRVPIPGSPLCMYVFSYEFSMLVHSALFPPASRDKSSEET